MAVTKLFAGGTSLFANTIAPKSWAIGQQFNHEIDNPLPRRRIPRQPHLLPYWFMDAKIDNDPVRVAPMLAQQAKPVRGLLGQSRTSRTLGDRDPRSRRNAQRLAGTSDWTGEGTILGENQKIESWTSVQNFTSASANGQISAGLVRCNPYTTGLELYLPDVNDWTSPVWVKNCTDYTSDIIIHGFSIAQKIDGADTYTMNAAFDGVTFIPDGHHWWAFGSG